MKKITIIRDKKLLIFVAIYTVLYLVKIFLVSSATQTLIETRGYGINPLVLNMLHAMVLFIAVWLVAKRLIVTVKFNDDRINIGILGFKSISYNEIKKVDFTDSIEIYTSGKVHKLPLLNMEDNEVKYEELIGEIKSRKNLTIDVNHITKKLTKRSYKENTGEPLKLSLRLIILRVYLIGSVISLGFNAIYMPTQPNLQIVHPVTVIMTALLFLIGVPMLIYMANKHFRATSFIKVYLWAGVLLSLVVHIESLIINSGENSIMTIISLPVSLTLTIIFALAVSKYLDISLNARNTFNRKHLLLIVKKKSAFKNRPTIRSWWSVAKITIFVPIALFLITVSIMKTMQYYMVDKNIYSSIDELVSIKGNEAMTYFEQDKEYYLIVEKGGKDKFFNSSIYYITSEGNIIEVNNWHEQTQAYYTTTLNSPFSIVYIHDKKYIILVETMYFDNDTFIYDNYGDILPTFKIDNYSNYYFKVLDSREVDDDYELVIEEDGEVVYRGGKEDFE